MMGRKYSEYVEDCLHRLDRGEDLLAVLADYPGYQEKLKSLLLVAMASRSFPVPVPNHTAQRLGKNHLLEEMEQLRLQGAFRKSPQIPPGARLMSNLVGVYRSRVVSRLAPSYRLAMVALVLVMSGGFLTLNTSASSQPGDVLYNLKLGIERVQLALPFNAESRQAEPEQVADGIAENEGIKPPRTTDRSILVLHGITYQLNQDGRPGVGAVAEAQAEYSPPAFANAQTNPGKGNDKPGEGNMEEPIETSEEGNQGKALGKEKSNQGKALGHNKVPEDDKTKDKEKDKDK